MNWLRGDRSCDLVIIDLFLKRGSGLGGLRAASGLHKPGSLLVPNNCATPDMRPRCLGLDANGIFDKSNATVVV